MTLRQTYQPVCDITLTDAEQQLLAKFSAHTMKLAVLPDGPTRIVDFMVDMLNKFGQDEPMVVERLAKIAEVFVKTGGHAEKTALQDMANSLQMLAATLPMKQLLKQREEEEMRNQQLQTSFKKIMVDHPVLTSDPKTLAQHFEVISRFAPDIAVDPTVTGSMLRQLQRLGPGALTHQFVGELRKLQEGLNAEREAKARQMSEAVGAFTRVA